MLPADGSPSPDPWDLLQVYRERYPIGHLLEQIDSLERSIERRRVRHQAIRRRMEDLEKQLTETKAEFDAVSDEIAGSRATGALLIEDILSRVRLENDERWSPTPLRGFRVWRIESDSIWGNQVTWTEPRLVGRCLRSIPGEDVPHSMDRCGPPACGIYAVKDLDMFPSDVAGCEFRDMAVGVVALAGKVIEHELGYRAQRASVVALAVHHEGHRVVTRQKSELEALFRAPADAIARLENNRFSSPNEARAFLESSRKEDRWT
ncbi:MAG TPA: hypothetical protein VF115_11620 [Acidimicrobiia bacterium]